MKKLLFIILFLVVLKEEKYLCFAQQLSAIGGNKKIDSAINVLSTAKHDTARCRLMIFIGKEYEKQNPDTAIHFYNKVLQLAEEQIPLCKKGQENLKTTLTFFSAQALQFLSWTQFIYKGNYDTSLYYSNKALKLFSELSHAERSEASPTIANKAKKGIAGCYNNIGNVHYYRGSYDKAIEYYLKSLKISEELGNKRDMSACYNNIGSVHKEQGSYDNAIEYYLKALKIREEIGDKKGMATCYNNIGSIHADQGSYDKANEYYLKALKIYEEIGDKLGMSNCYNNIGLVHTNQDSYDKAIEYYLEALKIYEEIGDKKGMASCYNNIGIVHRKQGSSQLNKEIQRDEYHKAIEYYLKSLKIKEELGDKQGIASSKLNIGLIYVEQRDFKNALEFCKESIILAEKIGHLMWQRDACGCLSKTYIGLNNYKNAIDYIDKWIELNDSVFNKEKTKALAEMEKKYEAEKKQLQIERQQAEISRQKAVSSRQKVIIWFVVCGLLLVIVFAMFIVQRLRITYRQKQIIEKQNKDITDSIRYAKRIQNAIFPTDEHIRKILSDSFILFMPKDIVSGDFYWVEEVAHPTAPFPSPHKEETLSPLPMGGAGCVLGGATIFIAAVDCTGHGVPGAFMSIVGNNLLNEAVYTHHLTKPADILHQISKGLSETLRQRADETPVRDGMDISLVALTPNSPPSLSSVLPPTGRGVWSEGYTLQFAGAFNSLWIIRPHPLPLSYQERGEGAGGWGEVIELKADRLPIGMFIDEKLTTFTNHEIQLQKGDTIYLFSDGYADQFGGPNGKKFMLKRFRKLLLDIHTLPMNEQKQALYKNITEWKGDLEQVDDILVIGVRI